MAKEQSEKQALTDPLTELPNRRSEKRSDRTIFDEPPLVAQTAFPTRKAVGPQVVTLNPVATRRAKFAGVLQYASLQSR